MVKMQAPKDVTQISVEQQVFNVDDNGSVQVPDPFVETLRDIGFRIIPGRITVSQEAADAIAAAAAKLNLPVPQELRVQKPTVEEVFSKFMQETSGGFHATNEDWTTVGMDASGWPVPKGSKDDVSDQPNPPERKAGSKEDSERRANLSQQSGESQPSGDPAASEKQPEEKW